MRRKKQEDSFQSTRWTIVAQARGGEKEQKAALESLCLQYWSPLYTFVRCQGHPPADAEDLIQGFFEKILERDFFKTASPEQGRLRSFLIHALKCHMASVHRANGTQKRGAGQVPIPLHTAALEAELTRVSATGRSPEQAYEYRWACALLDKCMSELRETSSRKGRADWFEALSPLLTERSSGYTITDAANAVGATENAVRVALFRLRRQFAEIVRTEVTSTLLPGEDPEDELQHLMRVLSRE